MPIETPAQQFIPPYPQALVSGYTGYGADVGSWNTDVASSEQIPLAHDLTWVAGDTAAFTFFFDGVCWTAVDPSPTAPVMWEYTTWRSQVRTTAYYYYGYWWPPTFPMGALLMEFVCTSEYVENDPVLGTGTLVTIKGGTSWPGDFKWDLQSEAHTDVTIPEYYEAHTQYQGKVKVLPQYTSPTIYPPSNWPVYSFASNPWPPQGPYLYP
jgi:hypothetical protein